MSFSDLVSLCEGLCWYDIVQLAFALVCFCGLLLMVAIKEQGSIGPTGASGILFLFGLCMALDPFLHGAPYWILFGGVVVLMIYGSSASTKDLKWFDRQSPQIMASIGLVLLASVGIIALKFADEMTGDLNWLVRILIVGAAAIYIQLSWKEVFRRKKKKAEVTDTTQSMARGL